MDFVGSLKPASMRNSVYELFFLLSLTLCVNCAHSELSFKGNGFQVYHIAAEQKHVEFNELKLWFRTKQHTGMLMMVQNGNGSLTLVGMYQGKLRCIFINNCKSPTTWRVGAVAADQSFVDGKWHKLEIRVSREMANSVIECRVDRSSTKVKVKRLTSTMGGILFLAGLPDSSQQPYLNGNLTCFPDVLNFSGCIADLEVNFVSSAGHVQLLNTTHAQQFGDVYKTCTDAKDSIVSISDKNSRVFLRTRSNIMCNTSFEFQIRTLESRAFVGKIMNRILTALFFLEEGNMKVAVKFEDLKGNSFHLTSSGVFLSNNQWHKVTFIAAEKAGVILLIDDELKSSYEFTNKLVCTTLHNTKESFNTIRFGRSARKYPSFIGCLRDVHVNKQPVNFSHYDCSKGISMGKCHELFRKGKPSFTEETRESLTLLRATPRSFVYTKSFDGRAYETSTTPHAFPSNGSSNTSGGKNETLIPDTKSQSRSNSNFDKAYPIAIALAVGLLIIFVVLVYVFSEGLKSRFQSCRDKTAVKENDKSKHSTKVQARDKEGNLCQSPAKYSVNSRASCKEQERLNGGNQPVPTANRESWYQDICKSAARKFDQNPIKAWEDRYLSHASKTSDSKLLLTVPQLHYSHMHHALNARSREKVSNEPESVVAPTNFPDGHGCVMLHKHGFARDAPSDAMGNYSEGGGGRRISTVVNSPSPKQFNKIYSGHDLLPKSKKAASLSWAYGTRFVRHESSDTDCSDIDRVTRTRSRNQSVESGKVITIRPRRLRFIQQSREDVHEIKRSSNMNHWGRGRRLRTFTEETHKLHSLKEEEREVDSLAVDQRFPFIFADTYSLRGRNRSTSFVEATVQYEDTVSISTQLRSLDGYTSSCPESIHCLSEKEDKRLNIRRQKRLTTHYF